MGSDCGELAEVFAFAQLRERCLGNLALVERVLAAFSDGFCADLAQLELELAAGSTEGVRRLAHRMKGAASNAAASSLYRVTGQLEQLAQEGVEAALVEKVLELRREWSRFQEDSRRGGE